MKQHERTHKGQSASSTGSDDPSRRSKAAVTKDAQKAKQLKKESSSNTDASQRSSLIPSPLSEVTSVAPTAIDTPLNVEESTFYVDPPQVLMPIQTIPENLSPSSLYPPLGDDPLLSAPLGQIHVSAKLNDPNLVLNGTIPPMPTLARGFSDLDTLAQAAESFDTTFYQPGLFPSSTQTPW
jgi:hypothetical protein